MASSSSSSSSPSSSSSSSSKLLILHPDSRGLYGGALKHPSLEPYVELDATAEDCDVVNVKREILSGKYKVILVCDLSENFDWLVNETVCISAVRNDDLGSCGVFGFRMSKSVDIQFGTTIIRIPFPYFRFTTQFRSCLRSFVHAGGIIAFPTCEGRHLCWYV